MPSAPAILCISSYEKGQPFLREAANLGCPVSLLTTEKLRHADWPRDALTNFFTMPENLTPNQILNTVTFLARTHRFDRIVPLDEFDLEAVALLREHLRLPGMGESQTRFFRDKLAMRRAAHRAGILVPEFTGVLHHPDLRDFMAAVSGPWLLKPRTNASAIGIHLIAEQEALWPILDQLGDLQSHYLLERFIPGDVFHAEGITWRGRLLFGQPFAYGKPPMQTMHGGGVFTTRSLAAGSPEYAAISELHPRVLRALNFEAGVTHTEFIRSRSDGRLYFLEIAARVGGAYIADVVSFARGVNPWVEWARIEVAAASGREYTLPPHTDYYAGSVICLARQLNPDLSAFTDPEIKMRLHKDHHAGILLQTDSEERLQALLTDYAQRFLADFCAVLPAPGKPTS